MVCLRALSGLGSGWIRRVANDRFLLTFEFLGAYMIVYMYRYCRNNDCLLLYWDFRHVKEISS